MKDEPYKFAVGDGATASINGDSYPYTIRKVSPSGKTVWASRDDFKAAPGNNIYESPELKGAFIPQDVPESEWDKFTLRQNGSWCKVATNYYFLSLGRSYRQDPSF
jgi:hypothetical protein